MRKQSRINLDRLELTYTASDEVRAYLSDKNVPKYELESVTLIRDQSRLYENEFSIIVQDYKKELGVFDCCIGHLHFGSPNPNRQHVYIVYENQALYNTVFVAIRYYLEDVLGLTFRQVSKIDIAVDFNFCIIRRFYQLYKNSEYDLIINGKKFEGVEQKVADVLHVTGNTTRKRPMANPMPVVKNSGGSLSLRLYNKTREIEEEVTEMCNLGEAIEQMGIEKGMEQGLKQGMENGMKKGHESSLLQSIKNLMDSMKWSAQQAMDALKIPKDEQEKYAARL